MKTQDSIMEMLEKAADGRMSQSRRGKKRDRKGSTDNSNEAFDETTVEPGKADADASVEVPSVPDDAPQFEEPNNTSRTEEDVKPSDSEPHETSPEVEVISENSNTASYEEKIKENEAALEAMKASQRAFSDKMPKLSDNLAKKGKGKIFRKTIVVERVVEDAEVQVEEKANESKMEGPVQDQPAVELKEEDKENREKHLVLVRRDTGEWFILNQDMTVGREEGNDIIIPRPSGRYVSEPHANINVNGKVVFLKDSDSTNGTFVNGTKIASKRLWPGQVVKFADIEFDVTEE